MHRILLTVLSAAVLGCALPNLPTRAAPGKQTDPSIRFPRPGEVRKDPFTGPMVRAIWVADQDLRKYLEGHHAPRCLASADGVDYLVGNGEIQQEGGKTPIKVFYVSAWLNPLRCNIPESSLTEDGYDYIVTHDGALLKAARVRHLE